MMDSVLCVTLINRVWLGACDVVNTEDSIFTVCILCCLNLINRVVPCS